MRKTKRSSGSDSELQNENENETPSTPKLDDGFYEIETIRRKRLRKVTNLSFFQLTIILLTHDRSNYYSLFSQLMEILLLTRVRFST